MRNTKQKQKKDGRSSRPTRLFYAFFVTLSSYFMPKLMSLFTFTASAIHTATTNVTKNNTVIINFLSFNSIYVILKRCKGTTVYAHSQAFQTQKPGKQAFS